MCSAGPPAATAVAGHAPQKPQIMIMQPLVALLHAALYVNRYANDPASMGIFVLIIVIGIAGYIVQARLQSVFAKYSEVRFPGEIGRASCRERVFRAV